MDRVAITGYKGGFLPYGNKVGEDAHVMAIIYVCVCIYIYLVLMKRIPLWEMGNNNNIIIIIVVVSLA